jgi:hypothetical protein
MTSPLAHWYEYWLSGVRRFPAITFIILAAARTRLLFVS